MPRFLAGDPAVSIIIIKFQRVVCARASTGLPGGCGFSVAYQRRHLDALALRKNLLQGRGLAPVDGKAVGAPDFHHADCEPAPVARRESFRSVLAAFLVAVHVWRDEGQVAEVRGEARPCLTVPRAQP